MGVPTFLAILSLLTAVTLFGLKLRIKTEDKLINGYIYFNLSCFFYFLILAGLFRSISLEMGSIIHPFGTVLSEVPLNYLMVIYCGFSSRIQKLNTVQNIMLIVLSLVAGLTANELLEVFILLYTLIVSLLIIPFFFKKYKSSPFFHLFAACILVAALGKGHDILKLTLNHFGIDYSTPYILRYTFPPLIFTSVIYLAHRLSVQVSELAEKNIRERVANQLIHDLKSPLAALTLMTHPGQRTMEETHELVRLSIARVTEISSSLNSLPVIQEIEYSQILHTLKDLIAEKRIEYRDRPQIQMSLINTPTHSKCRVKLSLPEFRRMISNLMNNSVEAIEQSGWVTLQPVLLPDSLVIQISDNGKGIAAHQLKEIGRRGASFGKMGGNGLGIYYCRQLIESWGGKLELQSKLGHGTTVTLSFPFI